MTAPEAALLAHVCHPGPVPVAKCPACQAERRAATTEPDYVVKVQMFGALADEKRRLDLVDAISRLVYAEGEPFGECVVVGHRYQAGEQRG